MSKMLLLFRGANTRTNKPLSTSQWEAEKAAAATLRAEHRLSNTR